MDEIKKLSIKGISKNKIHLLNELQSITGEEFPENIGKLKYINSYKLDKDGYSEVCACSKGGIYKVNEFEYNYQTIIIGSCCIKFLMNYSDKLANMCNNFYIDYKYNYIGEVAEEVLEEVNDKIKRLDIARSNIRNLIVNIKEQKKCKMCNNDKDCNDIDFCNTCKTVCKINRKGDKTYCKCIICERPMTLKKDTKGINWKIKCYDCFKNKIK